MPVVAEPKEKPDRASEHVFDWMKSQGFASQPIKRNSLFEALFTHADDPKKRIRLKLQSNPKRKTPRPIKIRTGNPL